MERIVTSIDVLHIEDLLKDPDSVGIPAAKYGGARTFLGVPMLKDNEVVGAIIIFRQEVRSFSESQIELVQNFANQALIAIENTRLLNELRQSLEQQTATSEVLQVISSSPGELKPAFEAMLANATRLCEAKFGILFRVKDGAAVPVATLGVPEAFMELVQHTSAKRKCSDYARCQHIADNFAVAAADHDRLFQYRVLEPICGQAHRQTAAAVGQVGLLKRENAGNIVQRGERDFVVGGHLSVGGVQRAADLAYGASGVFGSGGNVHLWHKADMPAPTINVCYWG